MNYDPRKAIRQAMMIARREVTAPNKASIKGQRHILAYITPYEAELLMRRGGSGRLTEYGVPAFDDGDGDGEGGGPGGDNDNSTNDTDNAADTPGAFDTPDTPDAPDQEEEQQQTAPPSLGPPGNLSALSTPDPGPPSGPHSGFGSAMSQDPEGTPAAANMNTAVNSQQQGYGVGIADTGGVAPTGFGAAPGIAEALDAYDKGIIGFGPALGYAALSAFSPPGLEFGKVTDEVGNQAVGGRGNIGGAIGGIAGMASGVPGAGMVGGMIGSAVANELGVPTHTFSFADGGAATGGRMDPRMLPGIHVRVPHERVGRADGGPVQQPQDEDVRIDDPIIGYHGSPHEFERFDPSKIGTGEGAQAFGHGMYLADNEDVARGYRNRLSIFPGGSWFKNALTYAQDWQKSDKLTDAQMWQLVENRLNNNLEQLKSRADLRPDVIAEGIDNINKGIEFAAKRRTTPGHMYEVAIHARPEGFLDWDAPLSEQHPNIQEFARNADISHLKPGNRSRVLMERFRNNQEDPNYPLTGANLVTALNKTDKHSPETSAQLRDAGIPGIKYFDAGSRGKGDGTRNYVVFHPKHLEVKRRYADGGEITPPRDLGADPTVQQALDATAPFSVSNPMAVFPKPQRMWEDQRPGGAYLSMPTKEDITGHKAAQAEIGVQPGGKPYFNVSKDAIEQTGSPGRGSATVKTNLFKQKAGWKWAQAPEGHENTSTLVSVEHRGKHHYALNTQFPKGVDLARYEDAPSEPRLRPTTRGNVELGEQVGTILVRGKEHPVYRNVIVRNTGGAVGYADGGMPGDDPTVQQALDITRQVQPTAPQMARQVQPQAIPTPNVAASDDHPAWIPTRLVTSKKAVATPGQKDIVDLESMRQTPKLFQQNVDLVRAYPNTPMNMANASHDEMADHFINHVTDNLLALHDAVPEDIRNRSKIWYDGSRKIVDNWTQKYNLPDHSIAAALAALSPQKDWYQNVSLAERVLNAMRGQNGQFHDSFVFNKDMADTFKRIQAFQKPDYENLLSVVNGKTLADISKLDADPEAKAAAKALWIRLHDETYNDRSHRIVTPEGGFGDVVRTIKGAPSGTGWGSLVEIGKAIRSIEAAKDPSLISSLMGEKHKVRNFYNNILAPRSPHGDVTIDTHAVAAGLLRPLSGNSLEVAHNFANYAGKGMPSAAGSALTGVQGTYPLYAEAYRRAARERGILPREMQSITWEAVRGLFPDTFKTAANNAKVDAVWNKYRNGEISQNDARGMINEIAGGIRNPSWLVEGSARPNEIGQASNEPGDISGRSLRGTPAEGIERGRGGKPSAAVSARSKSSRPPQQIEEVATGGSVVDRALRLTSNRPMVALADIFQRQLRGRPPS
jgi:hypothetical protein